MTKKEIKKIIGSKNWKKFYSWMRGQTCGVTKDGELDFYDCDVQAFITKLKTGFDRQNSIGWD